MNKLEIVIPALNEEDSIKSIIERSLDARTQIIKESPVNEVGITVVSDGSTDNTVKYAQEYIKDINLIIFEKNKGYGAAIKEGWKQSDADLLSFLDADGTCSPLFFINLCNLMAEKKADIVLGSRLNENSEMPLIRRIGNTLFSVLLSVFASNKVKDTASGMRVVKRSALERIMPLPDGLHFTPAMSARAVLSDDLSISEIDMPYKEREGESKLHVLKDGVRFLNIILGTAFLYKPNVIFNILGFILIVGTILTMITPISFYLQNTAIEEWMIYRFVVSSLMILISLLFLTTSGIAERIVNITLFDQNDQSKYSLLYRILNSKFTYIAIIALFISGFSLVYNSLIERLTTGQTFEHWSRYIATSTLLLSGIILLLYKGTNFFLSKVGTRLAYKKEHGQ